MPKQTSYNKSPKKGTSSPRKRATKHHHMPWWQRLLLIMGIVLTLMLVGGFSSIYYLWSKGYLPSKEEIPAFVEKYGRRFLMQIVPSERDTYMPYDEIIGIDISHHQLGINWDKLTFCYNSSRCLQRKANDETSQRSVDFVIAKATEGKDYVDARYKRNKEGAREHDFCFGAYHFFSPFSSGKDQADHYIRTAALQSGDIIPILDIERENINIDELLVWLTEVGNYYHVRPIIYTYHSFYQAHLKNDKRFQKYPLWIAHYGRGGKYHLTDTPPNYRHILWQCCETATVSGIGPCVDMNIFHGTQADFKKYCLP